MSIGLPDVQIGYVTFGSGFGGSDAAVLFDGNTPEATTIDFVAFDAVGSVASFVAEADGVWTPRLAQIGVLGAFAGNLPAHDLAPEPPIGSPGTVVPEPRSSHVLAISAVLGLLLLGHEKRRDVGGTDGALGLTNSPSV